MSQLVTAEFFGGAITAQLSREFETISHIREVPDHQEVFVNIDKDQSIIVEILELADAADDSCAAFHFHQLAEDNDAENFYNVQSVSILNNVELPQWPANAKIYLLMGQQRISKFNERGATAAQSSTRTTSLLNPASQQQQQQPVTGGDDGRNLVQIFMLVVRLPTQETDIVLSYNVPLQIAQSSSSRAVSHEGDIREAEAWFRDLIGTLKVQNWGLFGSA